ncbi:MAG: hypothetical protein FWD74_05440 [Actinomycetia bacterium]|nr:hypothetical protein [Actinomycetes bacterium]
MAWTWRLEAPDGAALAAPSVPAHASQSDAESWLGEHWRDLAEAGVAQTSLLDGDRLVYGPMPLALD